MPSKYPSFETELNFIKQANTLAGKSIDEIAQRVGLVPPPNLKRQKGWIGHLVEYFFNIAPNNHKGPDLPDLGIEIKTLPLKQNGTPKETTYVCTAPKLSLNQQNWMSSEVRYKLKRVLFVPIIDAKTDSIGHRYFGKPILWEMDDHIDAILKQDWEELIEALLFYPHDLNANLGEYLHIRPKAANSQHKTTTCDISGNPIQIVPKGFYLRTIFTQKILDGTFS